MSDPADEPLPDAVSALVEVASCEASASRGEAAIADLTQAVRRAAGASIAMTWAADPLERAGRAIAWAGLTDGDVGRLATLVGQIPADSGEAEIAPGEDGPLAAALAGRARPPA